MTMMTKKRTRTTTMRTSRAIRSATKKKKPSSLLGFPSCIFYSMILAGRYRSDFAPWIFGRSIPRGGRSATLAIGGFVKQLAFAIFLLASLAPTSVRALNPPQNVELRGVSGTIVDKDEHPVDAAVVYLKNARTLTVRTYITNDKG